MNQKWILQTHGDVEIFKTYKGTKTEEPIHKIDFCGQIIVDVEKKFNEFFIQSESKSIPNSHQNFPVNKCCFTFKIFFF